MVEQERAYGDPAGMPEDERMDPAEFRAVREWLAVTGDWLAEHLAVNPRTVRAWEQGRYPIPDGVREALEALEETAAGQVEAMVAGLLDSPEPRIVTYASDDEYAAVQAGDGPRFPAAWHRRVAMRAATEVPGVAITYASG